MTTARKARAGDQHRTPDGYEHLTPLFTQLSTVEDKRRRTEIRDELVTGHLPLAHHIATRFARRGVSHEDLVQVATVGLINAVDRFDPHRGTDFLSFAIPTAMGEVRRHFRDTTWAMRVPRRLKELNQLINTTTNTLAQQLGRAPTPHQIARAADLDLDDVHDALEAGHAYHSVSLDHTLSNDVDSLATMLGENDAALETVDYQESLQPLIWQLPERERHILTLRFFRNLTQSQIAERTGISQMHVSRLLTSTLKQLRAGLGLPATSG